jgi:hypothetical protein
MKKNNIYKFGGAFSILVGIFYFFVGLSYLMLPAEQKAGTLVRNPEQFLASLAQNSNFLTIHYVAFVLGGLFGLAVVAAVSELMKPFNEGWIRWTSHLAYLGFVAVAIDHLRALALEPMRAAEFVAGDSAYRAALAANNSLISIDPHMWLECGGVGLWIFVISFLSFRKHMLPKILALLGIVTAILYWFVVIGTLLRMEMLISVAAFGSLTLGPFWYIWIGLILRRKGGD